MENFKQIVKEYGKDCVYGGAALAGAIVLSAVVLHFAEASNDVVELVANVLSVSIFILGAQTLGSAIRKKLGK